MEAIKKDLLMLHVTMEMSLNRVEEKVSHSRA